MVPPGTKFFPFFAFFAFFAFVKSTLHTTLPSTAPLMAPPTLRRGTVDDARQIADHNIAMARETESLALDDATCLAGCRSILGDSTKGFYTVAVEDGRIVGQLMITYEWSDWRNRTTWWIQSVYVVPDRRGRGIFKALYGHVRGLCEEEGGAGLRLYADDSNVGAQAVYGKLGMVRGGDDDYMVVMIVMCHSVPLMITSDHR